MSNEAGEVFCQHLDFAYRVALLALCDPAEAEDAVQDAFLRFLRGWESFDRSRPVRPFLARIVACAAANRARAERRRAARQQAFAAEEKPMRSGENLTGEDQTALRAALAALEEPARMAVAMRYMHGMSLEETAEALGVPRSTASDLASRGLENLRKALAGAGFAACAPAALGTALGSLGIPPAPAGLAAKLAALAASSGAAGGSGLAGTKTAVAASATTKGGMAMKIALGAVLAGALAGGVALLAGPPAARGPAPTGLSAPPAAGGKVTHEHVAGVNAYGRLDGPARESIGFGGQGFIGGVDDGGNLWEFNMGRWMRASDGRIMSFEACEYGSFGFNLEEGPIIGQPKVYAAKSYGWPCRGETMLGQPDSGGRDEGIYQAIGRQGKLVRIWKNKEKGGRWWFARAAGGGAAEAPKARGKSADALAIKFGWLNQPQTGLDGKVRFLADSCFYLFEGGKVTCILGPDDYKAATDAMNARPNEGHVGGDGTIYLGYYYQNQGAYNGSKPAVWRVTSDGKVEPFAQNRGQNAGDGDALNQAGWFCGPHFKGTYDRARFIPPDALLTSAHDEDFLRRIWKGRVSVLCEDGEWREFTGLKRQRAISVCGVTIGSGGVVYHDIDRSIRDMRLYRYTGLDFAKPTSKQRDK